MMEINEKHRIIWKNEFEKNDKNTHLKRYLFLLDLFKSTVKQKDYLYYDTYRDISEYFDFSKNYIFQSVDYDNSFILSDKEDKQHEEELLRNYRKNIHYPKKNLSNGIWILGFLSILTLLYGGLYFLHLKNDFIKTSSFCSLFAAPTFFTFYILFKLYIRGNSNLYHLTKE